MRGKYKRKRLNKKCKKYAEVISYYRHNPIAFAEEMLGVKLYSWQKVYLNAMLKAKDNFIVK